MIVSPNNVSKNTKDVSHSTQKQITGHFSVKNELESKNLYMKEFDHVVVRKCDFKIFFTPQFSYFVCSWHLHSGVNNEKKIGVNRVGKKLS